MHARRPPRRGLLTPLIDNIVDSPVAACVLGYKALRAAKMVISQGRTVSAAAGGSLGRPSCESGFPQHQKMTAIATPVHDACIQQVYRCMQCCCSVRCALAHRPRLRSLWSVARGRAGTACVASVSEREKKLTGPAGRWRAVGGRPSASGSVWLVWPCGLGAAASSPRHRRGVWADVMHGDSDTTDRQR